MERIPHVVAPAWTLQGDIKTQPGMANVLTAEANRRETLVFNLHLNVSHPSKLTLNGKTENRDVNSSAQAFKLLFVFCFLSPACFMTRGHSYRPASCSLFSIFLKKQNQCKSDSRKNPLNIKSHILTGFLSLLKQNVSCF